MRKIKNPKSKIQTWLNYLIIFTLLGFGILSLGFNEAHAQTGPPYSYRFPKAPASWGNAVDFGNLSPGFFQVMFQNRAGIVRIATYGIVGASMDKLRDPQLMMVFAFNKPNVVSEEIWLDKEAVSGNE
ncbi:MAG: hypothetical protein U9R38_06090 [Candidatus Margulisiibacteriota bacterium]|nr:hypothetical protein [Candidatus Margulisiibacteriota bacterium]